MIVLVLLISLILRIISLDQSLWLDEAINILAVRNSTFLYTLLEYPRFDFHPPGYFVILWLWTHLFGYSEIIVRIPSVIFGILTVWLVYLVGKNLMPKKFSLWGALLCAVNPLLIYYSQEARPYSFAAFTVVLSYYYFLRLLKNERSSWLGYSLSLCLLLTSDYLAYFTILAQGGYIILNKNPKLFRTFTISLILPTLLLFSWSPFFYSQLKNGLLTIHLLPAWKTTVGKTGFEALILTYVKFIIGRLSWNNRITYTMIFLLPGLLSGFLLLKGITQKLLAFWLIVPIITTWLLSFLIPIFDYFRVLFTVPAFIMLIVKGVQSGGLKYKTVILGIVALAEISFSLMYLLNPKFHREDWRSMTNFLVSRQTGSSIVLESSGNFAPIEYYAGSNLMVMGGLKNIPAADLEDVRDDLGNVSNVYLVNYLAGITDPKRFINQRLLNQGFKIENVFNFNNVGLIYQYTKR